MADYWKSNPRKFCDVCKCWFADNRSSIDFHERGKRHQEAVRQRLADLARKGREDQIKDEQIDADMKRMEEAALAAFKKDVTENPSMAKQYGVTIGKKKVASVMEGAPVPSEQPPAPPQPKWHEAKSDQGWSYYWHIDTGESVWEPPEEGYVPLSDDTLATSASTETTSQTSSDGVKTSDGRESNPELERVPSPKSELDDREAPPPGEVMGPMNRPVRADPYGSKWETIETRKEVKSEEPVDLQLPEQRLPKQQASVAREKPRIVFKQRTVSSLGVGGLGSETFKKRSAESGKLQRNIRQRTDE